MIEAVLCDIDGTLVDSNWLHAAAWQDAFHVAGFEIQLETIRKQIGKGGDELIPVFVPDPKRSAVEESLKAYRKFIFREDYLAKVKPFPCVRDLFLRLKENSVRISLASSADASELKIYERLAGISDITESSTSADDADRSKPHPDIFEAALAKLKLSSDRVLALGDTPYDAEAAGKASIRTIGVMSGGWSKQDLKLAGCIEVYRDVADLLQNLESSALLR